MNNRALIIGANGQDGSYLCDLLLEKGYEVHGTTRCSGSEPNNLYRIQHLDGKIYKHYMDLEDEKSINDVIKTVVPHYIYNMGAQSHVGRSFEQPYLTTNVDYLGFMRIMETLKTLDLKDSKVYQAGSSEQFGISPGPQNENTPMIPVSPYGVAKAAAYMLAKYYRKLGFWATVGLLYNHESERRPPQFVTSKIVKWSASVRKAMRDNTTIPTLKLGNMMAKRDWGYSKEYMEVAIRMMTELNEPVDLVIATGEQHTVIEWWQECCKVAEIPEDLACKHLIIDQSLFRGDSNNNAEVPDLLGDASKAKQLLGWEPKVKFKELVRLMVEAELKALEHE